MKGFRLQLVLLLLSALVLTACQVPSSVTVESSSSPFPKETLPEPFRPLIVGLDAPTWDNQEKTINYFGWDRKIDNTYTRIKTSEKVIAITFDDGPHGQNTPRLLDMLKKRNIKATFYVVGNMVTYNPQILRRMIAEGHEIGNHTVSHGNLARMSNSALRTELQKAHDQILKETGIEPRTMRPPGGAITRDQKQFMLEEFGYPTILWSVDPMDWKKPGPSVVTRRLLDGAAPGGILLVHDLHKATVDAMPATLDGLLAQGYRFVTVTELIAMDESGQE
ncbi:MAG: polysaccharide deacetylase family protein [Verrucomicrobiales bacterium]|nr:polysaccharide deacetylase family protein [Verrucomicrobiales bacterium]